jgi:hypothetical protein
MTNTDEEYQQLKTILKRRKADCLKHFLAGGYGNEAPDALASFVSQVRPVDELWVSYGMNWVSDATD